MWELLKDFKGAAYLTVLSREFLLEDVLSGQGQPRIDNNPVNSKTYNVSFHNKKQEYLHQKQEIIIALKWKIWRAQGFLPVRKCAVQKM